MSDPTEVSTGPLAESPGRTTRPRSWLRTAGTVLLGALGTLLVAAAFIHVPYVIISPGAATPIDGEVVQVSGAPIFPHEGDLLYLTVRVTDDDPNLYRWLFAKLDSDVSVDKKEEVIGCASYDASARLSTIFMQESQDLAKTIALGKLGYTVTETGSRVLIEDVVCDGPSRGKLEPGDLIVDVDGTPVTTAEQVRPLIEVHRPGEILSVTVERDGERRRVDVRLGERDAEGFLGIYSRDLTSFSFPVVVKIDTKRVSGPSAGLSFTLAIIDDLTPGDLTGGRRVAVTGTIGRDGSVGIVGGIRQKAITARDNGAALMLVPKGEARDAREAVGGDLRIVTVATIDDALRALERAGGKGVPPPPPTTAPAAPAQ